MDLIGDSLSAKIMIEKVEGEYLKSMESIEQLDKIHMEDVKKLIESPIASKIKINLFLREWEKLKKREIESLICKVQLQLKSRIEYLLDVFSKWKPAHGKY